MRRCRRSSSRSQEDPNFPPALSRTRRLSRANGSPRRRASGCHRSCDLCRDTGRHFPAEHRAARGLPVGAAPSGGRDAGTATRTARQRGPIAWTGGSCTFLDIPGTGAGHCSPIGSEIHGGKWHEVHDHLEWASTRLSHRIRERSEADTDAFRQWEAPRQFLDSARR